MKLQDRIAFAALSAMVAWMPLYRLLAMDRDTSWLWWFWAHI